MSNKSNKVKKIKKLFKYTCFFLLYLLLLYGALCLAHYLTKEEPAQSELPPEAFFPADYSADITENVAYQSLDHSVYYMNYGTGESLTEENHKTLGIASDFFYQYFNHIINGNAAEYRSMLTDLYIEQFDPPEKFTKQMLYDISVNQSHSASTTTYNGETVNVYHFAVSYKIFENNGTFRRDIASNQSITQYYDLVYYKDKMLLNQIRTNTILSSEEADTILQKQQAVDLCVIGVFVLLPIFWFVIRRILKRPKCKAPPKNDEKLEQKI